MYTEYSMISPFGSFGGCQLTKTESVDIGKAFTVYIKELNHGREAAPTSHKVNALQTYHQVDKLAKKTRYEFWVTAHTRIGEGSASIKVTSTPSLRVPAKIASFDDK
jgi:hypothetical protein